MPHRAHPRIAVTGWQFCAALAAMLPATCALAAEGAVPDSVPWRDVAMWLGTGLLAVLVYFAKQIWEDTRAHTRQLGEASQSHKALSDLQTQLAGVVAEMRAEVADMRASKDAEHAALWAAIKKAPTKARRKR